MTPTFFWFPYKRTLTRIEQRLESVMNLIETTNTEFQNYRAAVNAKLAEKDAKIAELTSQAAGDADTESQTETLLANIRAAEEEIGMNVSAAAPPDLAS